MCMTASEILDPKEVARWSSAKVLVAEARL
jgi:hypothetical protein